MIPEHKGHESPQKCRAAFTSDCAYWHPSTCTLWTKFTVFWRSPDEPTVTTYSSVPEDSCVLGCLAAFLWLQIPVLWDDHSAFIIEVKSSRLLHPPDKLFTQQRDLDLIFLAVYIISVCTNHCISEISSTIKIIITSDMMPCTLVAIYPISEEQRHVSTRIHGIPSWKIEIFTLSILL